jgi:hypothetical protein
MERNGKRRSKKKDGGAEKMLTEGKNRENKREKGKGESER